MAITGPRSEPPSRLIVQAWSEKTEIRKFYIKLFKTICFNLFFCLIFQTRDPHMTVTFYQDHHDCDSIFQRISTLYLFIIFFKMVPSFFVNKINILDDVVNLILLFFIRSRR